MINNVIIYDQITLRLASGGEYYNQLLENSEGTLKFFVRSGNISAVNPITTYTFEAGEEIVTPKEGLTRKQIFSILTMIKRSLDQHPPLKYGYIHVDYRKKGDSVSGKVEIEDDIKIIHK